MSKAASRIVRMRDIAEKLGVTTATVSMALRNDPRVAAATRQRVQQTAEELGYRKNPLVAALMENIRQGRADAAGTSLMAYLGLTAGSRGCLMMESYRRTFEGARKRALELGFTLDIASGDTEDLAATRLNTILRARSVRGILLMDPRRSKESTLPPLNWENFAVANVYRHNLDSPFRQVRHDFFQGMTLAVKELRARGYKLIGLPLGRDLDSGVKYGWSSAFLVYQQRVPPEDRVPFIPIDDRVNWRDDFHRWLDREKPDAIVTHEAVTLEWLADARIKLPDELGFVLLDRQQKLNTAAIDQQNEHIGATAINVIVAQLHRNETGFPASPETIILPGVWREGPTVRPPKTP